MVRPLGVRGNRNSNTNDAEQHENQRPPRKWREIRLWANCRYYRAHECDDPGKLLFVVSGRLPASRRKPNMRKLTLPMEMVARAKGSPKMRPSEKDVRPLWPYPFSILRIEGEP